MGLSKWLRHTSTMVVSAVASLSDSETGETTSSGRGNGIEWRHHLDDRGSEFGDMFLKYFIALVPTIFGGRTGCPMNLFCYCIKC